MAISSPSQPTPAWHNLIRHLSKFSWSWGITIGYLTLMLFVEEAYKQYKTQAAYSAAVLLTLLVVVIS